MPPAVQQFDMVFGSQVRRQETNRRQVHRTIGQEVENDRESAGCPSAFDPVIGGMLGQVQHPRARGEQRRTAFREVEAPPVEFREVSDQQRRRLVLVAREAFDTREQLLIGKSNH